MILDADCTRARTHTRTTLVPKTVVVVVVLVEAGGKGLDTVDGRAVCGTINRFRRLPEDFFLTGSLRLFFFLSLSVFFSFRPYTTLSDTMHRTCIRHGGFIGYTSAEN